MELKGIKMAVLGDSITEGHGVADKNNMYYNVVARECGVRELYVDGISGTRFARQSTESEKPRHDLDFLSRIESIDADSDLVLVFGGTNDFGHGDAPLGSPEDKTPYTFHGACNLMCEMLIERFPESKIVFMGPLHREVEDNPCGSHKEAPVATLYEYVDIIKTTARKYSIPFLDLMAVAGITPRVPALRERYMPDGLHPNDAGHARIAERLKYFLLAL
ncbi:MAG: SGNH/GDSL hydrolase family protein [Clostridia bacterium]|nr:SGNH/GDSL hydrolase family protein [Clostridia bacterium]